MVLIQLTPKNHGVPKVTYIVVKKETQRCEELYRLQREGTISDLEIQKRFELIPPQKYETMKSERACSYIADFVYVKDDVTVIEECRDIETPDYIIKRKLMKQRYCCEGSVIFIES